MPTSTPRRRCLYWIPRRRRARRQRIHAEASNGTTEARHRKLAVDSPVICRAQGQTLPAVSRVAAASWWHAVRCFMLGLTPTRHFAFSTRWLVASTCTALVFSRRPGRVTRAEIPFSFSWTLVEDDGDQLQGSAVGCSVGSARPGPGQQCSWSLI